ncbi:MAG: type II secretion system protein [Actinomycetota bacterium]
MLFDDQGRAVARVRNREDGFTLVELMVVVMIIAVLVAIGIPTSLSFRSRAQDLAAQQSLAVAQKATFVIALQSGNLYPAAASLVAIMPSFEGSRDWVDGVTSSTGPSEVSVENDAGGRELAMAVISRSGSCFYLRVSLDVPPARHEETAAATCTAHDYIDGADTGW